VILYDRKIKTLHLRGKTVFSNRPDGLGKPSHLHSNDEVAMGSGAAPRVGFLGAGKMATALARGWIAAGLVLPGRLLASDPVKEARLGFSGATGARVLEENKTVVQDCDVLILAVKPQNMMALLEEIRPSVGSQHLIISIAAGITLRQISDCLGSNPRLVRVMPNTPCLVGASASGYAFAGNVSREDRDLVERLLQAVGVAFCLPEVLLDAVTGLSGSGPAFVFTVIEALSDGGVRMGLPRQVATTLAAQTVLGAAKMALETGSHLGQLRDMVTSPGGTTIAGLHALERGGLRAALIDAVEAATKRSAELAQQ
jgi:pyrroline-5-carboxylate reductase